MLFKMGRVKGCWESVEVGRTTGKHFELILVGFMGGNLTIKQQLMIVGGSYGKDLKYKKLSSRWDVEWSGFGMHITIKLGVQLSRGTDKLWDVSSI